MAHCADTNARAFAEAGESMVWYPKHGSRIIADLAGYARSFREDLGTYHYAGDLAQTAASGALDRLDFDYIRDAGAAMVGDPDRCIEIAKRYRAAGCTCSSACSTRTR
jgi:alkanesulfonate monooxygenase SsuD/methylene tetrahydromethanopterin reductase-like flavin-dependent oxidoreductase (luciferase family)